MAVWWRTQAVCDQAIMQAIVHIMGYAITSLRRRAYIHIAGKQPEACQIDRHQRFATDVLSRRQPAVTRDRSDQQNATNLPKLSALTAAETICVSPHVVNQF